MQVMASQIPSADEVRQKLAALERGQFQELSKRSGVPITTLTNIRDSGKQGPTVDTLRKFWPHLLRLARKAAA
jgi:predicted transcriptional regulator